MTKIHVSKRLLGSKLLLLFKISCGALCRDVLCAKSILMVEGTKSVLSRLLIYMKVVDGKRKRRERRKKEKREKVKKKFFI